jgi:hypothetical protein
LPAFSTPRDFELSPPAQSCAQLWAFGGSLLRSSKARLTPVELPGLVFHFIVIASELWLNPFDFIEQ